MAVLTAPAQPARLARIVAPRIARTGIRFRNLTFERVAIELELTNPGTVPTTPVPVRVEAAAYGAFLPWRPLSTQQAPAIEPGGSARVTFEARRERVEPIASFSSVPPRQLAATAAAAGDAQRLPGPGGMLSALMRRAIGKGRPRPTKALYEAIMLELAAKEGLLPPDLYELLGHAGPHWVGNLNVFIGQRAVERHFAQALRVYPGRLNHAVFCLGGGPNAYRFELDGAATAWDVRLCAPTAMGSPSAQLTTDRWHDFDEVSSIGVSIVPPEWAERGKLDVHVHQRSTGHEAVVEFDLDPEAAGPGCYAV